MHSKNFTMMQGLEYKGGPMWSQALKKNLGSSIRVLEVRPKWVEFREYTLGPDFG